MAGGRLLWNDVQIPRLSSIDFSTFNSTNPGKHLSDAIDGFIKLKTNEANADLLRGMIQAKDYSGMQDFLVNPENAEALKNADFDVLQKAYQYKQNQVALDTELLNQTHTKEWDAIGDLVGRGVMAHRTGDARAMEQVRRDATERGISGTAMEKLLNRAIEDERAKRLTNDATSLRNTKDRLDFQRYEKARPGIIAYLQEVADGTPESLQRARNIRKTHPGIAGLNDNQFQQMLTYAKDNKLFGDDTNKRFAEETFAKAQIEANKNISPEMQLMSTAQSLKEAYDKGEISAKQYQDLAVKAGVDKLQYDPEKFNQYLEDQQKAKIDASKQVTQNVETTAPFTETVTQEPVQKVNKTVSDLLTTENTQKILEAMKAGKISATDIDEIRNDIYRRQNMSTGGIGSSTIPWEDSTLKPLYDRLEQAGITRDMLTPELVNSLRNQGIDASGIFNGARARNMGITPQQHFVDKYTQNMTNIANQPISQPAVNMPAKKQPVQTYEQARYNSNANKVNKNLQNKNEKEVVDNIADLSKNATSSVKNLNAYATEAKAFKQMKLNEATKGKNAIYGVFANTISANITNGQATNLSVPDITTAVTEMMKNKSFNQLKESDGKSIEISIDPGKFAEQIKEIMDGSDCTLAMAIAAARNNITKSWSGSTEIDVSAAKEDARKLNNGEGERRASQIINLTNDIANIEKQRKVAETYITNRDNYAVPFSRATDKDKALNQFMLDLAMQTLHSYAL